MRELRRQRRSACDDRKTHDIPHVAHCGYSAMVAALAVGVQRLWRSMALTTRLLPPLAWVGMGGCLRGVRSAQAVDSLLTIGLSVSAESSRFGLVESPHQLTGRREKTLARHHARL